MGNPSSLRGVVPKLARLRARFLRGRIPIKFEVRRRKPKWLQRRDRFSYQERYVSFDVPRLGRVLDIGSGDRPFPHATVLVDRFLEISEHRHQPLDRADKPLILADIHSLPFRDKCFDFVYCSHVLEHVQSPLKACAEITRVGKRGFIETPTMGKDALFAWARDMHRWHLVAIGRNLCFFEYSQRQLEGVRSSAWRELIFSRWYHPLQEVFYENQDLFNVMFAWFDSFTVFVFHLDGTVKAFNAKVEYCSADCDP